MSGEDAESELNEFETEFENDFEDFEAHALTDRRISELHPAMLGPAVSLIDDLRRRFATRAIKTRWSVFEAVRSAERQRYLHSIGKTPFQGWQSAHQYGLAIDLHAYDEDGARVEHPTDEQWQQLAFIVQRHGLEAPYRSHPGHIQHPQWPHLRRIVFPYKLPSEHQGKTPCSAPSNRKQ